MGRIDDDAEWRTRGFVAFESVRGISRGYTSEIYRFRIRETHREQSTFTSERYREREKSERGVRTVGENSKRYGEESGGVTIRRVPFAIHATISATAVANSIAIGYYDFGAWVN